MDILKWIYSFIMLLATIGWSCFTVTIVRGAISAPTPVSVIEASGTSVLLGALIGWNTTIVYHWFRKKNPAEG